MQALVIISRIFFDICLLRKGPQDLPASREFLLICAVSYVISNIILGLSSQTPGTAVAASLFEVSLLLIFMYSFLSLRSLRERWIQTCTALSGIGTIFSLVAAPLFYWFASLESGSQPGQEFYFLLFILIVWNISVMAHIFKHALSISFPVSIVVSILLIWCMTAMSSTLFPREVLQ